MRARSLNRSFFIFILFFVLFGFFIFSSASLGLLNRGGASYGRVAFGQLVILLAGLVALLIGAKFDYHLLRRLATPILLSAMVLSLLVFIPGFGFESGGARRWLLIGSRTFQPSEFLKLGLVIYLAAWLTRPGVQLTRWRSGLLPFLLLVSIAGVVLVLQPDLGTFFILLITSVTMFFVAGGRWSHLLVIFLLAIFGLTTVIISKDYARERIETFLNPEANVLTSSYQINQSLVAIGSGGLWGRGFGQSLQKFRHLPEPIGDSVFAVAGEEFGLVGGILIILSFIIFSVWGFRLALRASDHFGRLLVAGVVMSISSGAFVNIASMLGLVPLTGIPLIFISHGGSSLLFSLIGCGIILSVAKQSRRNLI